MIGLDEAINGFQRLQNAAPQIIRDVMRAGAMEFVEPWKQAVKNSGHVRDKDGGQLRDSLTTEGGDFFSNDASDWTVIIGPDGKKKRKNSKYTNLQVGTFLHQGVQGRYLGDRFADDAWSAAQPLAIAAMQKKLDELMNENYRRG